MRNKKAWLITLSQDVMVVSGRSDDDKVVEWLRWATDTRYSWNDFIESGDTFITLDLKLAEGLIAHFRDDRNNKNHHSQIFFFSHKSNSMVVIVYLEEDKCNIPYGIS